MKTLKNFFHEEEGLATIEIVLILCVLAALAFTFRGAITKFFKSITDKIEENIDKVIN